MKPNVKLITIDDNLSKIVAFINDVIISPRKALRYWSGITNQTPAVKIGYIGQHLASLITGMPGTRSGARGDDLVDGTEVKSCNKIDQADKCKDCGNRVMRTDTVCPVCGSGNIDRKDDSKWLFSIRDDFELKQYHSLDRVFLLLMDYPGFDNGDFSDIRISAFEIYPKEERMKVFNDLIDNHYWNIYRPKADNGGKTNPMNLHPWSFQFYKCNPVMTFQCLIKDIDVSPQIEVVSFVGPEEERCDNLKPVPMPSSLLKESEWSVLLSAADYETDIRPLLSFDMPKDNFEWVDVSMKSKLLPFLDEKLRGYIPLRPIVSTRQKSHYHR